MREAPDPREGEPAFAQSERVRRWASDGGHTLVALCQDLRTADGPERQGLRAVLDILRGGVATAVVVPDLTVLSPDKIVQEIMLRDLRARGATVISASEDDHVDLEGSTRDRVRMIVRDVLTRLDEHQARLGDPEDAEDDTSVPTDVVVELVSPQPPEPVERIRPVR